MKFVVYRETFELVGYGFSPESLKTMPIALRRYYFKLLQEKLSAQNAPLKDKTPINPKTITYDPVKSGM